MSKALHAFTVRYLVGVAGLALGGLVSACGGSAALDSADGTTAENGEQEIVNGSEVPAHSLPWQIRVNFPGYDTFCGGSLIHPRWVLTAGHCFFPGGDAHDPVYFTIASGEHSTEVTESSEQTRTIERVEYPPNFESGAVAELRDDVALIRLSAPFEIRHGTQTIALPGSLPRAGNVSGWGFTEPGESSPVLRAGRVEIQPASVCEGTPNVPRALHSSEICALGSNAAGDPVGSCGGDSGGPLYAPTSGDARREVHGIVSWGVRDCLGPSVFARVSSHADWIRKTVGEPLRGNVRMRWSGQAAGMSKISLTCEKTGETASSSMIARGTELSLQCTNSRVRTDCKLTGTSRTITQYQRRVNGGAPVEVAHGRTSGGEWFTVNGSAVVDYECRVGG